MVKYKRFSIVKKKGRRNPLKKSKSGYVVKSPGAKSHIIGSWRPTMKQAKKYVDEEKGYRKR